MTQTRAAKGFIMLSVDQARKILGEKAKHMTDKEIRIILDSLYRLSYRIIEGVTKEGK